MVDFAQNAQDFLLKRIAATCDRVRGGRELKVDLVVRQELAHGHLVKAEANLGLGTKETKAGHGRFDRVHVYAPQIDEENDLELELSVFSHGYVGADIGRLLVVEEESVAEKKNLA